MAFAPDGRLFVAEKDGDVRIIKQGALLGTPFLSVNTDVCCERGLLGITLDPDFATNGFVYVYYTATAAGAAGSIHNRVSRFTADPSNADVALAGSEQPILDLEPLAPNFHNGGAIHFGPDGKLYVAVGDNYTFENAQMLTTRLGKMLRINPDGTIPADNPFYNTPGAKKEIWALGLRNPFTFAFSSSGLMYINDVGNAWAEEIDAGEPGANYGWPLCEGACLNPNFVDPVYAYTHEDGSGKAITGGAFYEAEQFPSEYRGSYFFGDYVQGFIKRLLPGSGAVMDFLGNVPSPVDIDVGPDGSLYYLSIGEGAVHRVQYVASQQQQQQPQENSVPVAWITASPASGVPPLEVTFDGSASTDPDQDEQLSYSWDFGDGSEPASGALVTHTYDTDGYFTARLTVDDGRGGTSSATAGITVGNPPAGTIQTPPAGTKYSAGDIISFSGDGSDAEDGILPDSAFSWQVVLHHNTHTHPFTEFRGVRSGNFTVPKIMETAPDVWFGIYLTVRDSSGLASVQSTDVYPNRVDVVLDSNIAGAQIFLDGQPGTAPRHFTGVTGVTRTLQAPIEQVIGGRLYRFQSWSDGGEATHTIDTPSSTMGNSSNPITYTAEYAPADPSLAGVKVNAYTLDGAEVTGLWSTIAPLGEQSVAGAYTPATFAPEPGVAHAVSAEDSSDGIYVFDHWGDDGSGTDRIRTVTPLPGENVTLAAYYRTPAAALAIKSADLSGNALNGMYAMVAPVNNSTTKESFTNSTYVGYVGGAYNVTASDYAGIVFDHWEDGTTSNTRTVRLYGDREITAYYRIAADSVMALTPLTHVSEDKSSLTLNAVSPDGSVLHMWSIIQPEEGGTYRVFVHDYGGYVFDHWEDGSRDRVRTLAVGENATITAHYAMTGAG
jgi:glucose/arabinose dehydrogenase